MATPKIFAASSGWELKTLPFGLDTIGPRTKRIGGICNSYNNKGFATLHRDVTNAVLVLSKCGVQTPTFLYGDFAVVKVSDTKYAAERKLIDGSSEIVTYQENGEVKAAQISSTGAYSPFPTIGGRNDDVDLTTVFMAMFPVIFNNTDYGGYFEERLRVLIDRFSHFSSVIIKENSLTDDLFFISDCVYQICVNGKLKVNIPDDGNIDMLAKRTVSSGALNGEVLYGLPKLLIGDKNVKKKTDTLTMSAVKEEFKAFADSRNWSEEEKLLIPQFPDDFPVPSEAVKMARRYIATKNDKRPMVNFMWRGVTSYGKSTGVEAMACMLNIPLLRVTCHTNMETQDFLSDFVPDTKAPAIGNLPDFETIQYTPAEAYEMITGEANENATPDMCLQAYGEAAAKQNSSSPRFCHVMSNYVKALTKGYIVEVQEVSRIKDSGVLVGLNEYDRPGSVIPLIDGSYGTRSKDAIVIFTDNVGYTSCRPMDPSVLRRMSFIIDSYDLPKDEVIARIKYNTQYDDKGMLEKCYKFWEAFVKYCREHDISSGSVSVTELEMLVQAIKYDGLVGVRQNIIDCLVSKATSDYEERQELIEFVDINSSKYGF